MAPASFNREFALAAACCRPLDDPARPAAVRAAAVPEIDWAHLLRVSGRHRVDTHVLDGLRAAGVDLPDEARALADRATAGAAHRLALTAEALRLGALFEAAGIPMLCVKGASLEMLAYGRTGFKHSNDIDMLVAEQDLNRAEDLLAASDYVCESPGPERMMALRTDPGARRRFLRSGKEVVYRRGQFIVEIHWRLANSRFLLPGVDVGARRQTVELAPGRSLATLANPELFAFIALHGAQHGWCRVKWLSDLVAFVAPMPADELASLHERAEDLRVGRCSAQALLLGERFLGLQLSPEFSRRLRSDRTVRAMVAFGSRVLTAEVPAGRVDEEPRFKGRLLLSHWQFTPHWAYRLELIASSLGRIRGRA